MKHLEKIIFLVSLLVVAGLSAWVFLGESDAPEDAVPSLGGGAELEEYAGIPEIPEARWEEPVPQDSEGKWLYRVFTPPILYVVDGRFTVERPPEEVEEEEEEIIPFGVRLAEIIRRKYRLQLDAVYEVELDDIDSALLSFENVYATQTERPTITLKKGETSEEHQFRVEDIRKEENIIDGGLETEHIATITDLENGKTLLLSDLDTLFEEGVTFLFESTENAGQTARLQNVGETFEMNEATYTLSEINLEDPSVELVKEADYLDVPERETLSPRSGPVPARGGALPAPAAQGGAAGSGEPDGLNEIFGN